MFAQIGVYLVEAVFGFFVFMLLTRFHFQWLRVSFRNQVGEFVLATTNAMVIPVRRFIPGLAGLDLTTLLLAWLLQMLSIWLQATILGADPGAAVLAAVAAVDLLRYSLYILVFALKGVSSTIQWMELRRRAEQLESKLGLPFTRYLSRLRAMNRWTATELIISP